MGVVKSNAGRYASSDGAVRVPPLIFSRMARGGKSTFLIQLFDALKSSGFIPIVITFNSLFMRLSHETELQAIVRMMALEMLTISREESSKFLFDQSALLRHISETSREKSVVLLIDELNSLTNGQPLDVEASQFLKDNFLDQINRYLVFTTHVKLDVDTCKLALTNAVVTRPSPRMYATVYQPFSTSIALLQEMSISCAATTPAEVALYGGVPSLIFSAKQGGLQSPRARFDSQCIQISASEETFVLMHFIQEVLHGNAVFSDVRIFDMFCSVPKINKVRWPICYIACIMSLFPSIRYIPFEETVSMHLAVHASRIESGIDWELIVQTAIMLHSVDAKLNGTSGPFGIVEIGVKPDVLYRQLSGECRTLEDAQDKIQIILSNLSLPTILLVTPTYAKFPDFDGFVCYKNAFGISINTGYQVKLGRTYPKRDIPSGWLKQGYLIRGNPLACSSGQGKVGWTYLKEKDIEYLLGFSLAPLCPNQWPLPERDDFD